MKIVLCYIVVTGGPKTDEYVSRFVATYHQFPPGICHETVVISNGGPVKTSTAVLLSGLKCAIFPRVNDGGWDISGYIAAAKGPCAGCDMMVCLGESNYFHREGWMNRLAEAWEKHGPGLYGPYATHVIRAHLMTTAFCCHPTMLRGYPQRVRSRSDRYQFEHGRESFWRRLFAAKVPVRLVTWDGEWTPFEFRKPENIMWRGDQSNLLMFCNHSDRWRVLPAHRKRQWSQSADRAFA